MLLILLSVVCHQFSQVSCHELQLGHVFPECDDVCARIPVLILKLTFVKS